MSSPEFKVRWTDNAGRDLAEIVASFDRRAGAEVSQRVFERLTTQADTLSEMPRRGRVVPESLYADPEEWRELIVRPYRLIYLIINKTVWVTGVFDARRNIDETVFSRIVAS